jgi:hypothetical protein
MNIGLSQNSSNRYPAPGVRTRVSGRLVNDVDEVEGTKIRSGEDKKGPPPANHRHHQILFLNKRGALSAIGFMNYFLRGEFAMSGLNNHQQKTFFFKMPNTFCWFAVQNCRYFFTVIMLIYRQLWTKNQQKVWATLKISNQTTQFCSFLFSNCLLLTAFCPKL